MQTAVSEGLFKEIDKEINTEKETGDTQLQSFRHSHLVIELKSIRKSGENIDIKIHLE